MEVILKDFFLYNLKGHLGVDSDVYINVFLLIFAVAAILTIVLTEIVRRSLHSFIRELARLGARDEESAVTLAEAGLDRSWIIKLMLSYDSSMTSKIVARVGVKTYTYEEYVALSKKKGGVPKEKIDFTEAKFYIRENGVERAKRVIESYKTPIYKTVLFSVLIFAVYVCVMFAMPELISLLERAFDAWKNFMKA
jgi:hypothetical protein